MQLVAYLRGKRIDATEISHDPWRALTRHSDYEDLVLPECGNKAVRVTRLKRQFFAHRQGINCQTNHKSESPQHVAMKLALKDWINNHSGWRAEVEYAGPGHQWIADVLAVHDSGIRRAFEVQLSDQTEEDYFNRSQRYLDAGIGPVWVVPQQPSWQELRLPVIVTGFGKGDGVPEAPGDLMTFVKYQPLSLKFMSVGTCVDQVLDPAFRWEPGSPNEQRRRWLEAAEAARQEAEAAAEAERVRSEKAEQEAAARFKVRQQQEVVVLEETKSFAQLAVPARVVTSRPPIGAGVPLWGCVVRCPRSDHSLLIWRLTDPASTDPNEPRWLSGSEGFRNVDRHVDDWLEAADDSVLKGKLVGLKGLGRRSGFACADCNHLIQGKLIRALDPDKWSVIAGPEGPTDRYVPSEKVLQAWESIRAEPPLEQREQRYRQPRKKQQRTDAPGVGEDAPNFVGPQRKPFWMTEVRDAQEAAKRQAAKDERAAQLRAVQENPRYRLQPNGFRFDCIDCGGVFEDGYEGVHADARCVVRR